MHLSSLLPAHLYESWHPDKNSAIEEEIIRKKKIISSRRAWWKCDRGHEWEAIIRNRLVLGSNCPYCSGSKVLKEESFALKYPDLAKQYHGKNTVLKESLSSHSGQKVWWLGSCGHEWKATVHNRVTGTSCPYCSGRKVLIGFNDFATLEPVLVLEWNTAKNIISPNEITIGSGIKVWWTCDQKHEWEDTIPHRREGRACPYCSHHRIIEGYNNLLTKNPVLFNQLHPTKNNSIDLNNISPSSSVKLWWLCGKGHSWKTSVSDRNRGTGCPYCSRRVSKSELRIKEYIESLGLKAIAQERVKCKGFELDIFIPEKDIAIEYNGLYWHDERTKTKTYHYDKWLACKKEGIQLIQIWEDEWNRNEKQIKRMLAHKLGMSKEEKVFARKTKIKNINKAEANSFLKEHHIQGGVDGSIRAALEANGITVAVMVLRIENSPSGKVLNLLRYATSQKVVGGFTKLLSFIEKEFEPNRIITFSDNCVSNGSLYKNNGFVIEKEINPDYTYVVNHERKHKFGYRLNRFQNDPNLQYVKGASERELAQLNNLPRIWDAGKIKWVKILFKNCIPTSS